MKLRLSTAFAALGCVLLASCYPYDESRDRKPTQAPPQKTVSSAEQQKIKEQRDKLKAEEDLKKKQTPTEETAENPGTSGATGSTSPSVDTPKPPPSESRSDITVANKVPGKEGYVFSPFNNKLIDVRGIPSGTLVSDPTYPESAKKHFRVP
jgi:hypothetical protein